MAPRNTRRELEPFQETVGQFLRYFAEDNSVIVVLRESEVQIPKAGLRILASANLKPGELVSIIRTDKELAPIRVRRLQ